MGSSELSSRLVKKIPPSGVAPTYKLSLPQQIVHAHLAHLQGEPFELATTATDEKAWPASVSYRYNRGRPEYTLKGWKAFAEAHNIQAGDQLAFELVRPDRLVIQLLTRFSGRCSSVISQPDFLRTASENIDPPRCLSPCKAVHRPAISASSA